MIRSLTWALECDRPQRRRSVLLQVLEVDLGEGRTFEAVRKSILRRGSFQRSDQQAGSAINNQAEYEALIVGMLLAKEMGAQSLLAKSDSLLVTG